MELGSKIYPGTPREARKHEPGTSNRYSPASGAVRGLLPTPLLTTISGLSGFVAEEDFPAWTPFYFTLTPGTPICLAVSPLKPQSAPRRGRFPCRGGDPRRAGDFSDGASPGAGPAGARPGGFPLAARGLPAPRGAGLPPPPGRLGGAAFDLAGSALALLPISIASESGNSGESHLRRSKHGFGRDCDFLVPESRFRGATGAGLGVTGKLAGLRCSTVFAVPSL